MFDSIGGGEILLILLAILVLFGPKRIPDLAQSLGKGLREFKKAQQDLQNNLTKVVDQEDLHSISKSLKDIHEGMTTSMQKMTGEMRAAVDTPKPPEPPTPPSTPPPPPPAV